MGRRQVLLDPFQVDHEVEGRRQVPASFEDWVHHLVALEDHFHEVLPAHPVLQNVAGPYQDHPGPFQGPSDGHQDHQDRQGHQDRQDRQEEALVP